MEYIAWMKTNCTWAIALYNSRLCIHIPLPLRKQHLTTAALILEYIIPPIPLVLAKGICELQVPSTRPHCNHH